MLIISNTSMNGQNQDIIDKFAGVLAGLDYFFQEGVVFTQQEADTLSLYASQFEMIARDLNVL
jgi:hypothetical protein